MKVLFVAHYISEKINRDILQELAKIDSVELSAITVDWYSKQKENKNKNYNLFIEKTVFGPHLYRYFFFPPLFLKILKIKPDIVFCDQEAGCVSTLQSLLWAKVCGAKFCFRSYENIFLKRRFPISLVEVLVLRFADSAIAGDQTIAEVIMEKGFKKNIFIAELGLSLEKFGKKSVPGLKKKLGIDKFAIAYFGRLTPEKSVETLFKASALLKFEHKIVIDEFFAEPKYKEELIELAKKKGIFERIIFVNPKHIEMPEYYNAIDVVVVPSKDTTRWKEQFGRTIIESMACGVCVIGSDSGSIPDVIGNAGLIFEQENKQDLAGKLSIIYKDEELREKFKAMGVKRVKENFTWEKIAKKLFDAFAQTLKQRD